MRANQVIIIKDASLMNVGMLITHKRWQKKRPAESIALTGGLKLYMYMTHAIRGRERQDHVLFKCFQRRRRRVHYVVVVAVVYTAVVNSTLSGCPLTSSAHYVKSITLTCDNLR